MSKVPHLLALWAIMAVIACTGSVDGFDGKDRGLRSIDAGPTSLAANGTRVLAASPAALRGSAGSAVDVTFQWDARPMEEDLNVFVHFVDGTGRIAFGGDYVPPQGTSTWAGTVSHTRTISIPDEANGNYRVLIGLYQTHAPWDRQPLEAGLAVLPDGELRYEVATLAVGTSPREQPGAIVAGNGKCLEPSARADSEYGTRRILVADCNGGERQGWRRVGDTLITWEGECLDVPGNEHWNGATLQTYACNDTPAQAWSVAGGRIASAEGLCLGTSGMMVVIATCNGGAEQRWEVSGVEVEPEPQQPEPQQPEPGNPSAGEGPAGASPGSYGALTFREEWDGNGVDYGRWRTQLPWWPENDLDNHRVEGGLLKMWSARDADGNFVFHNLDLNTDGSFSQRYGWFEIEAKLPPGVGQWPSFWLYAHNDATRPEIDIMEAYSCLGGDWCDANGNPNDYSGTLWMGWEDGSARRISQQRASASRELGALSDAFHRYGAHWEPDGVTFYLDGTPIGPKVWTNEFNQQMYIVLGVGPFHEPLAGTPSSISSSYQINYVRAWALGE